MRTIDREISDALRDGVAIPAHPLALDAERKLDERHQRALARYYIHAGLVFTPLSHEYMKTLGRDFRADGYSELIYELYYRRVESPDTARPEPIVLASTLPHPANANLRYTSRAIIDRINGLRIERLEDVIRAFEAATNTHHVLELLPNHALETVDRAAADTAHPEILQTYAIPQDRRL